jgi:cathepsin C
MTIQELNRYAGRKRKFQKEAKSIYEKDKINSLNNNDDNNIDKNSNFSDIHLNNIQQNLKFANSLEKKIKDFKSHHQKNQSYKNKNNHENKISEINKFLINLNSKDFARNIKFKSIYSVTNAKKNKNKKFKIKKMTSRNIKNRNRSFDKDFKDLPKNFKRWANYMSSVRNQGKCGSCYAVSTLNMLESRLNIKFGIKEELSLDHVLNCSVYNQGCEGGYSYLVLKFAKELELIPKRCEKVHNEKFQCGVKKCKNSYDNNNITSYKVKNFGYLGGSYGKCSEELLMRELQKNGPVVVSFEPDYHFMMYKKGIYKSLQSNWMSKNLQKPEWEKVDHSVTLVGWGYDEVHEKKYWLLLNSWGKHWGENGYFRMIRGEDHNGIESICEVGEIVPENL